MTGSDVMTAGRKTEDRDASEGRVMIGLEIHQQLDTPKLFCRCPSRLDEGDRADVSFERRLRPTQSELGEVDRAALAEAAKGRRFRYVGDRATCCLVEMDEEPPHAMSPEAVEAALEVALLLEAEPVSEVHVMRKIVIDGSNTSGFQRTSLLATGGRVKASRGDVRLQALCLEEDSARKVEAKDGEDRVVTYRLDRLGTPLVEIATAPDIKDGEHAREVALALGTALRATGKVKRGIGTIRQDLNISVGGGARVEVKGVQELILIPKVVAWEVARHRLLRHIAHLLAERNAVRPTGELHDVTALFVKTEAKVVRSALDAKGAVLAVVLPGFAGLLKGETKEAPRFGRDLAEHAKVRAGVKGIFHSDELPAYGITEAEVAEAALAAVAARAAQAFDGVPEETRDALPDGTTAYLRPLPGSARMYPETDVPPYTVTAEVRRRIAAALPELPEQRLMRWKRDWPDLGDELASQVLRADPHRFERLAKATGSPRGAALALVGAWPELEAKVPADAFDRALPTVLAAQAKGVFAKEAFTAVLAECALHGTTPEDAVAKLGLGGVDTAAVEAAVDRLLAEKADYVKARGAGAVAGLMGPLMAQFKGKVPGETLNRVLREKVAAFLAQP